MKHRALATLMAMLIAGGAVAEDRDRSGVTPSQKGDRCGAATMQDVVGLAFDISLLPTGDRPVRVIRDGMAVTMDHRPERLNIELDDAERIERVRCG